MSDSVSPDAIADTLGLPRPTAEQAAVIAAPLGPTLVVAGAGAGKTETMAARVVWMVANRQVTPDQVLGLTFTRKAAQQLAARIRTRLARLAGSALLREIDPAGDLRTALVEGDPQVSTYNSYAGRLLAEHGLLLPIEPSAMLLTETQLWQLAYRVVSSWDGELDTDRSPTSVTESVLKLAGQLAEHLVEPDQVRRAHTTLEQLVLTLPKGPKQRKDGPTKDQLTLLEVQHERVTMLSLVEALTAELRARGALDFGSQMSLAARVAAEHPEVGVSERQRFRLVLLDEYQDTGHAQRVLLSALFGAGADRKLAVTAVGDPMQSIYGWRGASAANLPRFVTDFPRTPGTAQSPPKPAPTLPLSTSWRNPPEALDLANLVSEPLRNLGVRVEQLRPRPDAGAGDVRLALTDTVESERHWVADQIAREYAGAVAAGQAPPTAAVLVRRNADSAPIAEALRARGLPVEVVGLGGLLHTPEVSDVVAMLRLVADPGAGSAAVRVLTGARWQLGIADLQALWRRACELSIIAPRAGETIADAEALREALDNSVPGEAAERAGLADAIADPGVPERYSNAGYARISALGKELAALRDRIGQPLTDLVADVEQLTGISIEATARYRGPGAVGREHLDAFADVVAGYATDHSASLTGLLAFLDAAEEVEDGLEPGEVQVAADRVQVLTVHAAKGLEWEVVAVPHVAKGVFPSSTAAATWLGSVGELPTGLRGDRRLHPDDPDGVPVLDLENLSTRADLDEAIKRHKDALARRRGDEDRRLFYVALTRTERALYVSAHHWSETGKDPKGPSEFLADLRAAVDLADAAGERPPAVINRWDPEPEPDETNPFRDNPASALWPTDPLGARRAAVAAGADAVRAALADLAVVDDDAGPVAAETDEDADVDDPDGWAADVDALLAEFTAEHRTDAEVALPSQLSVSQLVELRADPHRLAARLRRPLPFPPKPLARRGTAFHAWLERRFGATRLLDLDQLPGAADTGAMEDADLARLQDAFLKSRWSLRSPSEVEVPFETALAGTIVRGRIDAVFREPDGWVVVDWKTGAEPTPAEERSVLVQLAAYRLAWARLESARTGEPEEDILPTVRAAFHYVRSGRTISPADLLGLAELEHLIESAGQD